MSMKFCEITQYSNKAPTRAYSLLVEILKSGHLSEKYISDKGRILQANHKIALIASCICMAYGPQF